MNTLSAWLDNPIFVKHVRSRLRRSQFFPSAVVVLVLCFFDAYAGWALNWYSNGMAFNALTGLQTILLVFMGASQVAASVGGARESGILDFHRVSPISPTAVTLGFFFGAPIREYALFAITLPFSIACVWFGFPTIDVLLETIIVLLLVAWLFNSLALMASLMAKKAKSGGQAVVGLIIFLFFMSTSAISGIRGSGPGNVIPEFGFFGIKPPWIFLVMLYALPTLFFFLLASVRKMTSDRAHPYSKRDAVVCLAVAAFLILGGTWQFPQLPAIVFIMLYALVILGCILTGTMTPNLGEYAKGIRRAEERGWPHLSYWNDLSLNRVALIYISLIVLIGSTAAWYLIAERTMPGAAANFGRMTPLSFRTPIASAVLVVAYYGLALQYFLLKAPRRGSTIMALFLFFIWLIPLVIALFVGVTAGDTQVGQFIAALSPLAGLVLSSGVGDNASMFWVEAATLGPALFFAFLFNNLVTRVRRQVIGAIHAGPGHAKPLPTPDPLAGDESDLVLL